MLSNKNSWWEFERFLSKKFCNEVIEYGNQQKHLSGAVGKTKGNVDLRIRNSHIAWLNDPWIYKEIIPFIRLANQNAQWNYSFHGQENMQFTKYSDNQYYGWHKDEWDDKNKTSNDVRKLSVTCALNEGNE